MLEILHDPKFRDFITSLNHEINLTTAVIWLAIAVVLSMIGGAIGGMVLAGKDLGYKFAAIVGSLFAPAGMIPAIIIGLLMLSFLTNY
jgi:ABC-type sugar transport system permease subunit